MSWQDARQADQLHSSSVKVLGWEPAPKGTSACQKGDLGTACRTRRDRSDEARLSSTPELPRQRFWHKV